MIVRRHGAVLFGVVLALTFVQTDCSKAPDAQPNSPLTASESSQPSTIKVDVKTAGPVVLTTSAAEFQVRPDGYVQASLLSGGKMLSLDEPDAGTDSDQQLCARRWQRFAFQTRLRASPGARSHGQNGCRQAR